MDEASGELAATSDELRALCQGVHPAILTEAGLGAAVRALARRSPLPVRVRVRAARKLPVSSVHVTKAALPVFRRQGGGYLGAVAKRLTLPPHSQGQARGEVERPRL